jgi:glycine cleavage system H protein
MGITTYASNSLGDITWVELPELDAEISHGDTMGAVESVKAAADIYAPLSGKVTKVNETLMDKPALIAKDPEGEGWIAEIDLKSGWEDEVEKLMDEAGYKAFTEKAKDES